LSGGNGNDVLDGGAGDDVYLWNGRGGDIILDSSGDDTVRIEFDGSITWSCQAGSNDLFLATENGVLIVNEFYSTANSIQRFIFSNGDVLTREDILERVPPFPPENP